MSVSGDDQPIDQADKDELPEARTALPDTVEQFAEDLRNLRHANAYPKLTTMQFHTGISKSTISAALKGDRLPSEKTVRALASFFHADVATWSKRRQLLDQKTPPAQTEPEVGLNPETGLLETPTSSDGHGFDDLDASEHTAHATPMVKRRLMVMTAIAVALLTATATSVVWFAVTTVRGGAQAATVEHYVDFANGVDPMLTVCRKDSIVAAAEERLNGEVFVEMMYSERCQAVWGRVTRYDGKSAGNAINMTIYPIADPTGSRTQKIRSTNTQSVHTSILMKTSNDTQICGLASIAQGDEDIEVSPPVCI